MKGRATQLSQYANPHSHREKLKKFWGVFFWLVILTLLTLKENQILIQRIIQEFCGSLLTFLESLSLTDNNCLHHWWPTFPLMPLLSLGKQDHHEPWQRSSKETLAGRDQVSLAHCVTRHKQPVGSQVPDLGMSIHNNRLTTGAFYFFIPKEGWLVSK